MTRLFFSLLIVSFLCFCATGCSNGTRVSGKVTFDDGSPLTVGTVVFETEILQFTGDIQKDGTYRMSADGGKSGIPNGSYKVAIANAFEGTGEFVEIARDTLQETMRPLVNAKFQQTSLSDLTCEVNGATTFDITVTRP